MKLITFVASVFAFLFVAGNAVPVFADEVAGDETVQIQPRQDEEEDPEPTDPTDPSDPTTPEDPEPAEPTEPEEPSEPIEPSDPTPPSFGLSGSVSVTIHPKENGKEDPEPAEPTDPTKPADTNPAEKPVNTDTGVVIQPSDGTTKEVEAKEIGTTVQKDGTVTVKDNDGKANVLPDTGEKENILLGLSGGLLTVTGIIFAVLFGRRKSADH